MVLRIEVPELHSMVTCWKNGNVKWNLPARGLSFFHPDFALVFPSFAETVHGPLVEKRQLLLHGIAIYLFDVFIEVV